MIRHRFKNNYSGSKVGDGLESKDRQGNRDMNVQVLAIVQARDGENNSPSPLRTQAS